MSLQSDRVEAMRRRHLVQQAAQRIQQMSSLQQATGGAIQIKLYVEEPENEIRRFNLDAGATYEALRKKVADLLGRENFRMNWQDNEGDFIVCESNDEFDAARQSAVPPGPLRIHIRQPVKRLRSGVKAVHRNVTCDGCNGGVEGTRFKCMECKDFDLCEKCHAGGKHEEHDMLVIRTPDSRGWKKVFERGYGPREESSHQRYGTRRLNVGSEEFGTPYTPSSTTRKCGVPVPQYKDFVMPFAKDLSGILPPGVEKTVEMNVDMRRPMPEIVSDIAQKLAEENAKSIAGGKSGFEARTQFSQKATRAEDLSRLSYDGWIPATYKLPQPGPIVPGPRSSEPFFQYSNAFQIAPPESQRSVSFVSAGLPGKPNRPLSGPGPFFHTSSLPNPVEQVTETLKNTALSAAAGDNNEESDCEWTQLDEGEECGKLTSADNRGTQEAGSKDERVEMALRTMEDMGFTNEGNLLRRLLTKSNGDISRALHSMK